MILMLDEALFTPLLTVTFSGEGFSSCGVFAHSVCHVLMLPKCGHLSILTPPQRPTSPLVIPAPYLKEA